MRDSFTQMEPIITWVVQLDSTHVLTLLSDSYIPARLASLRHPAVLRFTCARGTWGFIRAAVLRIVGSIPLPPA